MEISHNYQPWGDYGQQRERDIRSQISVSEATGPPSSKVTNDTFPTRIAFFLVQGRDDVAWKLELTRVDSR